MRSSTRQASHNGRQDGRGRPHRGQERRDYSARQKWATFLDRPRDRHVSIQRLPCSRGGIDAAMRATCERS